MFEQYPVSEKSIQFCIDLAKENIPTIQIYAGEFSDLKNALKMTFVFKEHPLNKYEGIKDERDWMSTVKGEFGSFFSYWKKVKKELV
jgi:deoxyribodipyrimidine photo-lyase